MPRAAPGMALFPFGLCEWIPIRVSFLYLDTSDSETLTTFKGYSTDSNVSNNINGSVQACFFREGGWRGYLLLVYKNSS